jgi:hypothetical protein
MMTAQELINILTTYQVKGIDLSKIDVEVEGWEYDEEGRSKPITIYPNYAEIRAGTFILSPNV